MTNTLMNRVSRDQLSPEQQAGWDRSKAICEDTTILEVFANSPKVSKMFGQHF